MITDNEALTPCTQKLELHSLSSADVAWDSQLSACLVLPNFAMLAKLSAPAATLPWGTPGPRALHDIPAGRVHSPTRGESSSIWLLPGIKAVSSLDSLAHESS